MHATGVSPGRAATIDLTKALAEDRLVLFLQPVVEPGHVADANGRAGMCRTAYHECLARILVPGEAPVTAADFIPQAEASGLVQAIDRRVLTRAFEMLLRNPAVRLAVNVSGLTVIDKSWFSLLMALIAGRRELAGRLVIEITETAAIADLQDAFRFVGAVKEAGCRVALDDFGAGYTSFNHLRDLPIDIVKIDGAYVRGVPDRGTRSRLIEAITTLAHYRGCTTVAECVESEDHGRSLADLGIQYLQGFGVGRPVPAGTAFAAAA